MWLFFAYQLFMVLHPMEGDMRGYWVAPDDPDFQGRQIVFHDLGRHGLNHPRWKRLHRAFTLPQLVPEPGATPDPFKPIRLFEQSWNLQMNDFLSHGRYLTVNESMAL